MKSMKYLETCLILLLALLILTCQSRGVFAQSAKTQTPAVSLEDTMKWLTEKINASAKGDLVDSSNGATSHSVSVLGNNGCSMRLHYSHAYSLNPSFTVDATYEVDLAYLHKVITSTAYRESTGQFRVVLFTDGDHISVLDNIDKARRTTYMTDILLFGEPHVDNEELANRVAKAFENLMTICKKSEKEPF